MNANTALAPAAPTESAELVRANQLAQASHDIALTIVIDSPEMFAMAGDELIDATKRRKQIEETRLSLTRPLDALKAQWIKLFSAPLERAEQAEKLLRDAMTKYQREERAKAEKLQREAEERARTERLELARKAQEAADLQRKQQEAAAAAEQARLAEVDELRASGDESAALDAEEALIEESIQAETKTQEIQEAAQAAQEALETALVAPAHVPAVVAPAARGISTRQTWKAEVTSLRELICAAADGIRKGDMTLTGYLLPNTVAINKVASALKSSAQIPGVRVYAEDGLAVRTSR